MELCWNSLMEAEKDPAILNANAQEYIPARMAAVAAKLQIKEAAK